VRAGDLAQRVAAIGVGTLIYTDTATDGMLQGPNLAAMDDLCRAATCAIIASGGVSTPEDVRALAALGHPHLLGAIVGKALYEGRTTLPDLLAAAGA
jgi:phosphoribosylformimino-5-aminoimidazole carboxamide ribotide isomerase